MKVDLDTKFNIGDKVYFVECGCVKRSGVQSIEIYLGPGADGKGEHSITFHVYPNTTVDLGECYGSLADLGKATGF